MNKVSKMGVSLGIQGKKEGFSASNMVTEGKRQNSVHQEKDIISFSMYSGKPLQDFK